MSRSGALEASEMLEAALEQMDGILAGTRVDMNQTSRYNGYHNGSSKLPPKMASPQLPILGDTRVQIGRITNMLDDIKVITDSLKDKKEVLKHLPQDQVAFLRSLVKESETNGFSTENCCEEEEGPTDTLLLRVSLLTEQVQCQSEKIQDLEINLEDQQGKLAITEEMLQKEVLCKNALETQKMDLMAEVSDLKIKLASAEAETKEYEEKLWLAQRQIDELKSRLMDKDCELTELKIKLAKNDAFLSTSPSLNSNCSTETEVDRLKRTIETLVTANNDKDTKINDLHQALRRHKLTENQPRRDGQRQDDDNSDGSDQLTDLNKDRVNGGLNGGRFDHLMSIPNATSTPDGHRYQPGTLPSPPSTIHSSPTPPKSPSTNFTADELHMTSRSPPTKPPRQINGESTGQHYPPLLGHSLMRGPPYHPENFPRAATPDPLGPHATLVVPGDSSTLPPRRKSQTERAEEEAVMLRLKDERAQQYKAMQIGEKKKKGIKKIFSKSGKYVLKRSNSHEDMYDDQEDERLGEFKRGGVRSTAGPRLGWSKDMITTSDIVVPFTRWDSERCALWLHELGLNAYVSECRRNVKNGEQLLNASSRDLEQDLGMKSHLHKKKLFLALKTNAFDASRTDRMSRLDHNWVTRWLDDIGLPQYKDGFMEGRVDGRMLHFLTVEDLLHLKVSSSLHHYSIKRAIQILRLNSFNPDCLRRRPSDDQMELENAAEEVQLWSNHRVMEWLRSIDLSEYAPNLRGSGVHGALMVLEPAFNAELFAAILSISPSKTLLRRHLKTHFTSLVGAQVQQSKREHEATSGALPLTPNMKIKFRKHGLFNKRTKSDTEFDNYVCPMDIHGTKPWTKNGSSRSETPSKENSRDNMNNEVKDLTDMLERERFLSDDTIPATDV